MNTPTRTTGTKKRYSSFVLAVTAYIAGILLFSFWSYSAQRSNLQRHTEQALADAAFAMQEILKDDFSATTDGGMKLNPAVLTRKHQSLTQIARQGQFNALGAISISNGLLEVQIAAAGGPSAGVREDLPISDDLKKTLLRLATEGQNTSDQLNPEGALWYAISYKALEKGSGIAFIAAQDTEIGKQELADLALRLSIAGVGMLLLAIPLITLFGRIRKQTSAELEQLNRQLLLDVELQKTREIELEEAISDLERFNAVSAGRETRIIELKAEVNELLEVLKREKRYNIDKID